MNDFEIINEHLTRAQLLRNEVEKIEKINFNNISNKPLIIKNIEVSIDSKSRPEDRCKSINALYSVSQKKLVKEVIQTLDSNQIRYLIKKMVETPPIGQRFEKMVINRNIWIDELIWYLTTKYSKDNKSLDDITDSINKYKCQLDSSLRLKGLVGLFIDIVTDEGNKDIK